jgi:hypothetical protein
MIRSNDTMARAAQLEMRILKVRRGRGGSLGLAKGVSHLRQQ